MKIHTSPDTNWDWEPETSDGIAGSVTVSEESAGILEEVNTGGTASVGCWSAGVITWPTISG
jgi:hypothetical protein